MGTRTGRARGRPKGAKNKRTAAREAAMKEMAAQIGKAVGDAFEGDALAYLISVYKDPLKPETLRTGLHWRSSCRAIPTSRSSSTSTMA